MAFALAIHINAKLGHTGVAQYIGSSMMLLVWHQLGVMCHLILWLNSFTQIYSNIITIALSRCSPSAESGTVVC